MNTDFRNLLGNKVAKSLIMKDGEPILALLRHQINKTLGQFLTDQHDSDPHMHRLLDKLSHQEPITFADLSILHRKCPRQFKQLTITAIKLPDGDLQVFNHHETPNVEIALACRASASIPIVLKPVAINLNGDKQFMDGGIYDISPCDYFDGTKNQGHTNHKPHETVVITFHDSIRGNEHLDDDVMNDNLLKFMVSETMNQLKSPHAFGYSPSFYERMTSDKIMPWLSQLKLTYLFTDRKIATREKLTSRYPNQCINIKIHSMSVADFKKAQKNKREIIAMSYLDTIEYLAPTAQQFDYFELLDEFKVIYIKLLTKSTQNPAANSLLHEIDRQMEFMSPKDILFKIIKPLAEKNMQSHTGFAFSRAVEMFNSKIDRSILHNEIENRTKGNKLFARTTIHAFFQKRMPHKLFNVLFEPTRKP